MAYDKVVDSTQLETALTTMANAIREKTGGTESLEWIANKGFADIISGIESGGSSILEMPFICGSFIPTEDITTDYIISVDLTPIKDGSTLTSEKYGIIVFRKPTKNSTVTAYSLLLSWYMPIYVVDSGGSQNKKICIYYDMYSSLSFSEKDNGMGFITIDGVKIKFTTSVCAKAGQEYVYMVVRMI